MENSTTCDHASVIDLRNVSAKDIATQFYYSEAEKFIILVLYPSLVAFGIVGNLAFLAVVVKIPSMRTITNTYLVNLAVCDIFLISTQVYDIFIAYLMSPDVRMKSYNTSYGCSIIFGLMYTGQNTGFWIVVIMSFERYMAICRPLQHRMVVANGRTKKLIMFAWTFGVLYTVLILPGFSSLHKPCILWPDEPKYEAAPSVLKFCGPVLPFYISVTYIVQTFPYIITVVLSSCMYYRIIKTLHTRLSSQTLNSKDRTAALNEQRAETARNQVARLLIATGVLLILCMAPYYVTRFNDALLYLSDNKFGFRLEQDKYGVLLWLVRGISTTNCVINPVIYSVTNRRYRKAFLQLFTCASGESKADLTRMTALSDESQSVQP